MTVQDRKLNFWLLFLGSLLLVTSTTSLRFANENYDRLSAEIGIGLTSAIGLGAILLLALTGFLMFRALPRKAAEPVAQQADPDKGNGLKLLLTMLGLAAGIGGAFYLVLGAQLTAFAKNTGQTVNPEIIQRIFSIHVGLIALVLFFLIAALFARNKSYLRVLAYAVLGFIVGMVLMRILGISPFEFMDGRKMMLE